MSVIQEVADERKKQGVSLRSLSDRTGISHMMIHRLEKETNSISVHNLEKIADALGYELTIRKRDGK